jgi:hypothetical protein
MVAAFTATTRAAVGPSPSAPVGNLKVDYAATINLTAVPTSTTLVSNHARGSGIALSTVLRGFSLARHPRGAPPGTGHASTASATIWVPVCGGRTPRP